MYESTTAKAQGSAAIAVVFFVVYFETCNVTKHLFAPGKLSIAVEEEDLINDKQREEVHQQNEEIIQLTANKEELAGNLQKCEEEKDEVMNLAKNFKTQVGVFI